MVALVVALYIRAQEGHNEPWDEEGEELGTVGEDTRRKEDNRQYMGEVAVALEVEVAAACYMNGMGEPDPDMMKREEVAVVVVVADAGAGVNAGVDEGDDLAAAEAHELMLEETVTREGHIW